MTDPTADESSSSPLERMLGQWREDKQAGREVDPQQYLDMLSRLQADASSVPSGPAAAAEDAPGSERQRVGPYELIEEIGRGGQGSVWRARDTRLNRQVALKLLSAVGSSLQFERFLREAEIASRLDHPAICAVYDTGTEDGVPYIAMRLVEGMSLAGKIRECREDKSLALPTLVMSELSEVEIDSVETSAGPESHPPSTRDELDQILGCITGAARGLHAAHEVGIVHRDIKPANLMVTAAGDPVILDFGLARDDEGDAPTLTQTGDLFGTPAYMSPEQVRRAGRLDRRTDVWSMGVTLYECLTLERPFHASTRHDLYHTILNQDPPDPRRFNRSISKDLRVVIATALEKDIDRRYQTAEELADDLARVRERRPVAARPIGPHIRFARWAQRNPVIAVSVTMAFLALGALLAISRSALERYESLSDGASARDLVVAFDALDHWPAYPDRIPAMNAWIQRAQEVVATLPGHEAELNRIREDERDGEVVGVRKELWSTMVGHLKTLKGQIEPMRARRETARTLSRRSLETPAALWQDTIDAIADERAHPRYGGLRIEPQIGLVPLGTDQESGFFEFAHLLSGEAPIRERGKLVITPKTGIVLVLLPPSTFTIEDANDAFVELGAYFISKYEMTQAQWHRFTGSNPSVRAAATGSVGWLHPVEHVYCEETKDVLARLGLDLPTEAQWAHAARGGTDGLYWCGGGSKMAEKISNLLDASHRRHRKMSVGQLLDDGYPFHAPVNAARCPPNPFGVHGVIGNVSEWCKDPWHDPAEHGRTDLRPGDGMRRGGNPKLFVFRGGHFGGSGRLATHRLRRSSADLRHASIGVRPVRRVR